MAKWEYMRVSVWFSGGPGSGVTYRLTPRRASHEKLLASIGLKVIAKDPTHVREEPAQTYDTITQAPWEQNAEKFYALIDAAGAEGWEPFSVREDGSSRVVHLRRQTA